MISPLLAEAVEDARLRGTPIQVLVYLHKVLEYGEYRTIKTWVIAEKLHVNRWSVSAGLKRLVELGYVRAGPVKERNVGSYMLLGSRGEAVRDPAA